MFFGHAEAGVFSERATQLVQGMRRRRRCPSTMPDWSRRASSESLRRNAQERERLLESERAARAEAERASRLKDEFLATLVARAAHAAQRDPRLDAAAPPGGASRASPKALETIERNARPQAQLIDDLLDVTGSSPASCASTCSPSIGVGDRGRDRHGRARRRAREPALSSRPARRGRP